MKNLTLKKMLVDLKKRFGLSPERQLLKLARQTISRPGAWTQSFYARNASGEHVPAASDNAVSFCSLGAIDRAAIKLGMSRYDDEPRRALDIFNALTGPRGIVGFNDASGRTQEEVVAMFDLAIKAA